MIAAIRRWWPVVVTAAVSTPLLVACGGSDEPGRPLVGEVAPAMAAVDAELGGPQQYFEVSATTQLVRLFVASEGATVVTPYVWVGGELTSPAAPSTAEGNTFVAASVALDPATVLDGVTDELPDSDVVLFTVVGGPGGAVQYSARVQSEGGGTLDVVLGPDGAVQSVDPGS